MGYSLRNFTARGRILDRGEICSGYGQQRRKLIILKTDQDISSFQPGDIVHVQGDVIPPLFQADAFYHVHTIKLIERK